MSCKYLFILFVPLFNTLTVWTVNHVHGFLTLTCKNYYCLQNNTNYECGSAVVTWLGDRTLHPVWSGHRIYKNEECARCHGVKKEDVLFWNATVICPVGSHSGYDVTNHQLSIISEHFTESSCSLIYTYDDDDLSRFKCSPEMYNSCRCVSVIYITKYITYIKQSGRIYKYKNNAFSDKYLQYSI